MYPVRLKINIRGTIMKKIFLIALIIVLAFLVLACSSAPSGQQGGVGGSAVIGDSSGARSSSGNATGPISPLTGLHGVGDYRPIQIQIDNEATGRPQYGIQDADVVYEALIEGADTRLSAIFNDILPQKVGPVRSSRVYFQLVQNEWDSIYVHDGGPYVEAWPDSYIYSPENGGDMKVRIDGTRQSDNKMLWHQSAALAYANVQEIESEKNYQRTQRNPMFQFNDNPDYSKNQDFTKVDIPFTGASGENQVEYKYDKSSDKLIRYNYGQPFMDATTNKPVEIQNVIVEYVKDTPLAAGEGGRILLGVVGNGKAEFFIGGKHMTGTWSKTDRHAGTVYKLSDGSNLVLKPGNTWIALQPDSKTITVE